MKLLQSMMSGAAWPQRSVLVICDLNLLTGGFVRAFLKVISEVAVPVYFFGATASDTHGKWIEEMTQEFLLAESDKGVALQGLQFPEEKPPNLGKLREPPKNKTS